MEKQIKFYKVYVERGHMGSGNGLDTAFYFKAYDAYSAMMKARQMPSVKHNKMALKVEEISEELYMEEFGAKKQSAYHTDKTECYKSHKTRRY